MRRKLADILLGAGLFFAGIYGGSYVWNVWAFPLGGETPFAWWIFPVGITIGVCVVGLCVIGVLFIVDALAK